MRDLDMLDVETRPQNKRTILDRLCTTGVLVEYEPPQRNERHYLRLLIALLAFLTIIPIGLLLLLMQVIP